ncbi:hypothetical protein N665_2452s0002 [Sinapis alba]|nr:hypothetical protein N665_2452s0002 [Sinapis alba]
MDIRKPSTTFLFVISSLVISLSSYNTLAASVINSANGDVCDVPCVPGYGLFECAHDCMVDGFSTGYCDKKSHKCCCTNKGI